MALHSHFPPHEHPFRALVQKAQIPLWKLRFLIGGTPSEASLSRMLRGIDPMPDEVKGRIHEALNGGGFEA